MTESMPALRFDGSLHLEDVPLPMPGPGEARIQILRAGICSTDREIVRGYLGFRGTLGHEFVGRVTALGSAVDATAALGSAVEATAALGSSVGTISALGSSVGSAAALGPTVGATAKIGDRVVGEINLPCGNCPTCATGTGKHCPTRRVLGIVGKDGAFARYVTLPLGNLHVVPDSIEDRRAVFVEPLAAALRIVEQLKGLGLIDPDGRRRALVIGDGKLGLLAAMVLRQSGLDVAIAGRHAGKLEIVRALGIEALSTGRTSREFDVVIDASGSSSGWELAMQRVRPQGVVVLKSTTHGTSTWNSASLVIDEVIVIGSRCGPFGTAIEWLTEGRVDPLPLLEAEIPLKEAVRAFELATRPGALKVQLIPEN